VIPTWALFASTGIDGNKLPQSLERARRESECDYVLQAKIFGDSPNVRVSFEVCSQDGSVMAAEQVLLHGYEWEGLSTQIAECGVQALEKAVASTPLAHLQRSQERAFEAYSKAEYFWKRRTLEGLHQAIKCCKLAIEHSATFAPAYIKLAHCYASLILHGEGVPLDLLLLAKDAANKALTINPNLAEAYVAIGNLNVRFELDWVSAQGNYLHAIERDPQLAMAYHWYGDALMASQSLAASIEILEQAYRLNPASLSIRTARAQAYYLNGEFDECERQIEDILQMNPTFTPSYFALAMLRIAARDYSGAVNLFQQAVELSGMKSFYISSLAYAHACLGDEGKVRQILAHLYESSKQRYVSSYDLALVHCCLQEDDQAVAALEQALDKRDALVMWLHVDPRLTKLRNNPAMQQWSKRFRLLPATAAAAATSPF
jgi:tetratricopeptide (TPR) repeat protein